MEIEYCLFGFIVMVNNYVLLLSEMFKFWWWDEFGYIYFYFNDLSVKVSGICLLEDKEMFIDYFNNIFCVVMVV